MLYCLTVCDILAINSLLCLMKYGFLFHLWLLAGLLYGQPWPSSNQPIIPNSCSPFLQYNKSGGSLIVNYDVSDELIAGASWYNRAIWPINSYYDSLSTDSLLSYLIVKFDTLIDPTNTYGFSYSSLSVVSLDSIWIQAGHVNYSGLNDTLWIDLVALDMQSHPTQHVFWQQVLVFSSSLSPGNDWKQPVWISLAPQIVLPADTLFGIRIRYRAPLQDTLGVVAGFAFNNQCANFDAAQWSAFYPNSYAFWTGFNLLLPTSAGGDLYYDCNANLMFDSLIDGRNYIQNWSIAIQLTSPDIGVIPIDDESLKIYPNPAKSHVYINSNLPIHTVKICNLQGQPFEVSPLIGGVIDLQNIPSGLHILIIETENYSYVKKLLVYPH